MNPSAARTMVPARLGLIDVVCIIISIIIGIGIFKTPADIFNNVSSPWEVLLVWTLGGLVSLIGALCFAELASAYPRSGGEYVYLTRAFGSAAGFYFAWAQLALIRPAGIAMLAFYLAESSGDLWNLASPMALSLSLAAIVILTVLHGVKPDAGRRTQNALTLIKVASLAGIVLAGLFLVRAAPPAAPPAPPQQPSFILAMVAVLFSYLGWNEAAYVAREVRKPERNLPLALILGTLAVMAIYLGVNAAYLVGLGFEGARATHAGPAEIINRAFGGAGAQVISLLIIITVLGSMNGMILTGSRIFSAMGRDHAVFHRLGRWHPQWHAPVWSLAVQSGWSIVLVLFVHTVWSGKDGFIVLLRCTAAVFWLFFLLTGLALFVLRRLDPEIARPFRVPLYPLTPLLFCLWCAYMLIATLIDLPLESLLGMGVLLAGVPMHLLSLALSQPASEDLQGLHEPTARSLQESGVALAPELEPR